MRPALPPLTPTLPPNDTVTICGRQKHNLSAIGDDDWSTDGSSDPVPAAALSAIENGSASGLADRVAQVAGSSIRSASYTGLLGFSRIGGVLIGNKPKNPTAALDCREFSWDAPKNGMIGLRFSGPACPAHTDYGAGRHGDACPRLRSGWTSGGDDDASGESAL